MYETLRTCPACHQPMHSGDAGHGPTDDICGACWVAEATSAQQRRAMEAKASTERQRFPIPEFLRKGQS